MSGVLQVVCPRCGKSGSVPASFAGRDIHCKKCDAHFIVHGPAEGPAYTGAGTSGAAPGRNPAPAVAQAADGASGSAHQPFGPGPPLTGPSLVEHLRDTVPAAPPPPPGPSLVDHLRDAVPAAPPPPTGPSLLDNLRDSAEFAPLSDEDEVHARQRYEARVLSKDRVAHYDDHGNLLSEAEYEERKRQGRSSVH